MMIISHKELINDRGSIKAEVFLLDFGVHSVPHCVVLVVCAWSHDCCHDGCDVEVRPREHLLQHHIIVKLLLTNFSHSLLHWYSSLIMDRLRLISIVVCLNQKPGLV